MCSGPLAFSCGPVGMVGISSFGALVNGDVSSVFLLELPLSVFPGSSVPSVVSLAVVPQVWGVASSLVFPEAWIASNLGVFEGGGASFVLLFGLRPAQWLRRCGVHPPFLRYS